MRRRRAGCGEPADSGEAALAGGPRPSPAEPGAAVRLSRRAAVRLLAIVAAALVALSLAGQAAKFFLGYPSVLGLVPRRRSAPFAGHWLALAAIFVFLSIDELAQIHEATMEPMIRLIGRPTGMWTPTWVILGLAAVAAVGLAYRRFVGHLGRRDGFQVAGAAALFVGGAAAVEMATAAVIGVGEGWKESVAYVGLAHLEEAMEMAGVLVFLDVLLRRSAACGPVVLEVAD